MGSYHGLNILGHPHNEVLVRVPFRLIRDDLELFTPVSLLFAHHKVVESLIALHTYITSQRPLMQNCKVQPSSSAFKIDCMLLHKIDCMLQNVRIHDFWLGGANTRPISRACATTGQVR
jgi:hypothetical protein